MKKFLSILLIALMLVSAVSITAFADNDNYMVSGVWTIPVGVPAPTGIDERVNITYQGQTFPRIFSYYALVDYIRVARDDGVGYDLFGGTNSKVKVIDFGSIPQSVSSNLYNWLYTYCEPPQCDGSSCPIKDVNLDEICDTCGNAVTMSMRASSAVEGTHFVVNGIAFPLEYRTSSLEGSLKDIMQRRYDEDVNWYAFITVSDTGVYHLRITNAPFVASRNTGMLYIPDSVTETEWTSMQYRLSGDYWAYNGDFTIEKGDSFHLSTVYATSNTFFFDDLTVYIQGENFFQLTPRVVIGQAVTIQEAGAQIRQVMMIVAIVAVSCLALWISFLILLRVLRTYLKQS